MVSARIASIQESTTLRISAMAKKLAARERRNRLARKTGSAA